jgi:hypothetical protein
VASAPGRGTTVTGLRRITGESLKPIGMILRRGFFGAVPRATGVGDALADR